MPYEKSIALNIVCIIVPTPFYRTTTLSLFPLLPSSMRLSKLSVSIYYHGNGRVAVVVMLKHTRVMIWPNLGYALLWCLFISLWKWARVIGVLTLRSIGYGPVSIYIYIYIYICVCVCVCIYLTIVSVSSQRQLSMFHGRCHNDLKSVTSQHMSRSTLITTSGEIGISWLPR